jgi:hypothetical protein
VRDAFTTLQGIPVRGALYNADDPSVCALPPPPNKKRFVCLGTESGGGVFFGGFGFGCPIMDTRSP